MPSSTYFHVCLHFFTLPSNYSYSTALEWGYERDNGWFGECFFLSFFIPVQSAPLQLQIWCRAEDKQADAINGLLKGHLAYLRAVWRAARPGFCSKRVYHFLLLVADDVCHAICAPTAARGRDSRTSRKHRGAAGNVGSRVEFIGHNLIKMPQYLQFYWTRILHPMQISITPCLNGGGSVIKFKMAAYIRAFTAALENKELFIFMSENRAKCKLFSLCIILSTHLLFGYM